MPAPRAASEAQRAIIAQLLETDADLREHARALVLQGLKDLRNLQLRGDPTIRAALAKSLAGPITQFIMEGGQDDGEGTLRAEMHEMMEEIRGEIMSKDDGETVERKIVPKS